MERESDGLWVVKVEIKVGNRDWVVIDLAEIGCKTVLPDNIDRRVMV